MQSIGPKIQHGKIMRNQDLEGIALRSCGVYELYAQICFAHVLISSYLTKISDQILCLMSPAQSQAFIWDHQEEEEDSALEYMDVDNEDRLYTFEITKTNEQEETVVSGPGFRVRGIDLRIAPSTNYLSISKIESPLMQVQKGSHDENLVPPPPPRLMLGECSQGFLSVEALPPRIDRRVTHEAFRPIRLRELL
jgi:hypothetical protein